MVIFNLSAAIEIDFILLIPENMDEKKVSTTRKLSRAMSREEIVKQTGGLSVLTATIFLAGEMAGSGALKLPEALVGSGIPCEISLGLSKINKTLELIGDIFKI